MRNSFRIDLFVHNTVIVTRTVGNAGFDIIEELQFANSALSRTIVSTLVSLFGVTSITAGERRHGASASSLFPQGWFVARDRF